MGAYATNTLLAGVFSALMCAGQLLNLVYASHQLHIYRRESAKKLATYRWSSFPLLLRQTYVACCASATLCSIFAVVEVWLFTTADIAIDPFHRTSLAAFDLESQMCAISAKVTCFTYGFTKVFSYLVSDPILDTEARA